MVTDVCKICEEHRDNRARVRMDEQDKRQEQKPFTDAPYLYPYNQPRYHALHLRAVRFALANSRI